MQTYQSHKRVRAAQIAKVTPLNQGAGLILADGAVVVPPADLFARYMPVAGDYLVEYEDGYRSISPRAAFEGGYTLVGARMGFGAAIAALKAGNCVARGGWNGKGMFLFLVPGSRFTVSRAPLLGIYPEGTVIDYHAHIDMKTAQGYVVPWLASQADMLAEDWLIFEDEPAKV